MSNRRELGSLLLFVHLFCVLAGLFARESGAELAVRLTRVLGPYLNFLNVPSQSASGFHLSHGMEFEDNHQFVLNVAGDSTTPIWIWPNEQTSRFDPFGFRMQRWLNLTSRFAVLVSADGDEALAELARAATTHFLVETQPPSRRFEFLCRRLAPLERDPSVAPPERFEVIYTADVWLDEAGIVRVQKRVNAAEAAPVVPPDSSTRSANLSTDQS